MSLILRSGQGWPSTRTLTSEALEPKPAPSTVSSVPASEPAVVVMPASVPQTSSATLYHTDICSTPAFVHWGL